MTRATLMRTATAAVLKQTVGTSRKPRAVELARAREIADAVVDVAVKACARLADVEDCDAHGENGDGRLYIGNRLWEVLGRGARGPTREPPR